MILAPTSETIKLITFISHERLRRDVEGSGVRHGDGTRNEKRAAKRALSERTRVFRVISEVKGRHPEGKEPRPPPGEGPRGLLPWRRSSGGTWSRNEAQCKLVGRERKGNARRVSSLGLPGRPSSLAFSFDQRHGVCAEDNKPQFGSRESGFAKTHAGADPPVSFKRLRWGSISLLTVYIYIVENRRAPVRAT